MKHLIIGTAGHIDHGKTTLIKAITGRDTDRLKEELKRGISIELGFTYFDLPSKRRAGIIDVPGHEKFIRNMLAGVHGIDIVLFVVAADEGMMPQSREHLEILNLLGLKNGCIVLTKCDKVDEEWKELVKQDVIDEVEHTFLRGCPIIEVSSIEKTGIEELKACIDDIANQLENEKSESLIARLPIDRSFTITGFGTIVTGTLISGIINKNDEYRIYPGDKTVRIRSIQVHETDVEQAAKGQRVALNLAGIKKEEVPRGSMLAPKGCMIPTTLIDIRLQTIDIKTPLPHRTRVRVYINTQEVFGRVHLLDREELSARDECYCQIKLEEPIVAKKGDRFILRLFSPMKTIGGAEIIDANPKKKKRFEDRSIEELEELHQSDFIKVLEVTIREHSDEYPTEDVIAALLSESKKRIYDSAEKLEEEQKITIAMLTQDRYYIHNDYLDQLSKRIESDIATYHQANPLRVGPGKESIRNKYFAQVKPKVGEVLLSLVVDRNDRISFKNEFLQLNDFNIGYTSKQMKIKVTIEESFEKNRMISPRIEEIEFARDVTKSEITEVFNSLIVNGVLKRLPGDVVILTNAFDRMRQGVIDYLKKQGQITVSETRDLLGTNRKTALALLEYLDQSHITSRNGDIRELLRSETDESQYNSN